VFSSGIVNTGLPPGDLVSGWAMPGISFVQRSTERNGNDYSPYCSYSDHTATAGFTLRPTGGPRIPGGRSVGIHPRHHHELRPDAVRRARVRGRAVRDLPGVDL